MYQEIWKDVEGYKGIYQVSNLGRVKSLARIVSHPQGSLKLKERILKQFLGAKDYLYVRIKHHKSNTSRVHRLVAQAFLPNPQHKPQVNHINGIKDDNRVSNLEWCTNLENQQHAFSHNYRGIKSVFCQNYIKKKIIKLNPHIVNTIRIMFNHGTITKASLARQFDVSETLIRAIIQNKIWIPKG